MIAGLLLLSWLVLITIEVMHLASFERLRVGYALTVAFCFAGFLWAWLPQPYVRGIGGSIFKGRLVALALGSTVLTLALSVIVGVNFKMAIGGAL